jgi:hypothetical protein
MIADLKQMMADYLENHLGSLPFVEWTNKWLERRIIICLAYFHLKSLFIEDLKFFHRLNST